MEHLLVDTEDGLRIVDATNSNFTQYAVQLVGTHEECVEEMKRLEEM